MQFLSLFITAHNPLLIFFSTEFDRVFIGLITTIFVSIGTRFGKDFWSSVADRLWLHVPDIHGAWVSHFEDDSLEYQEIFSIKQFGSRIRGEFEYRELPLGEGDSRTYSFEGLIKGSVVTAKYWGKKEKSGIPVGSGCFLFVVLNERTMKGGCTYFETSEKVRFDSYTLFKDRNK